MSIASGNRAFIAGNYVEAILEYASIDSQCVLKKQADFNVDIIARKTISQSINCISRFDSWSSNGLSVIVPTYNVEDFIDATILSIIHQFWSECELIVVDDNSSDNTYEKCLKYQDAFPQHIKCFKLPVNTIGGCGPASNFGISKASKEFIAFCDSDDLLAPNSLRLLVEHAVKYSCDCVIGDFKLLQNDGSIDKAYDRERLVKLAGKLIKYSDDQDFASIFRLSPVPWRKIYKASLLKSRQNFPEVDHFFEDNPFHWEYLSRCRSVFVSNDIVAYHRMGRPGQTMGATEHLLVNHFNNPYYIQKTVSSSLSSEIIDQYNKWLKYGLAYVYNDKISDPLIHAIAKARHECAIAECSVNSVLLYSYKYLLTIIIPCYESLEFLRTLVPSIINLDGCQVIIVDNDSSDGSYEWLKANFDRTESFLFFKCKAKGAGRARNLAIPFALGEFCYFHDVDDDFDSNELLTNANQASLNKNDLFFFSYKITYVPENKTRNAFDADNAIFSSFANCKDHEQLQLACLSLINYPWNRIIRTRTMRLNAVVFGHTIVNNDIPFHWHSILSSTSIGYNIDSQVCNHRKFSDRNQITNLSGKKRLQVIDSLEFTFNKIRYCLSRQNVDLFVSFCSKMSDWCLSQGLIKDDDKAQFKSQINSLKESIAKAGESH